MINEILWYKNGLFLSIFEQLRMFLKKVTKFLKNLYISLNRLDKKMGKIMKQENSLKNQRFKSHMGFNLVWNTTYT